MVAGAPSVQSAAVNKLLCRTLAMIALAFGEDARAADSWAISWATSWARRDTKAPAKALARTAPPRSDWTGFYVGAVRD